jgi:hypothetical protein
MDIIQTCPKCNIPKPLNETYFAFRKDSGKYRKACKECLSVYHKKYYLGYYQENKQDLRFTRREKSRQYRKDHPDHWLKRYGLTREKFDTILAQQGGVCSICKGPPTGKHKTYQVDHDHRTGAVRGLVCHMCNMAIAYLRDRPDLAKSVAQYLETPPDLTCVCYPYLKRD